MRNFRLLKADEIECRISQVFEEGVSILLYKTARTDYQLLDEVVGMFNWQNKYAEIDGKMYCGIGIHDNGTGEWIWKWNCGTESNTEAEKGQASDAMKRAGFAWGIGTELYSAPNIYIGNERLRKRKDKKVYDKFYVKSIGYNNVEDIDSLVIINQKGEVVFVFGKSNEKITEKTTPQPAQSAPQATQSAQSAPPKSTYPVKKNSTSSAPETDYERCNSCGEIIKSQKVVDYSIKKFGVPLCMDCQKDYAR